MTIAIGKTKEKRGAFDRADDWLKCGFLLLSSPRLLFSFPAPPTH